MADGPFPSLISKDRDLNAVANPIWIQHSDGTAAGIIPGTGATNLGKAVDSAGGATDSGIAALVLRDDALTTLTPVDGDYVRLRVDSTGALWTRPTVSGDQSNIIADDSAFTVGTDTVGAVGFLADETAPDSVDEGDIGIARMTLDRKQLFVLVDATVDSQRLEINSDGEAQVDVAAHALTNSNPLPVSRDNSANSENNPIYVHEVDTVTSGSEVQDHDEGVDVASDASSDHDYTVGATVFMLTGVDVSGSGSYKYEIQVGPTASLVTVAVGFSTDRQGDTDMWRPPHAIEVLPAATGIVKVIRTNRQGSAVSIYSTIYGNDVT